MAVAFKKATKEQSKLRLGLCGPAGAGKTYTALRIASALGGKVAVIDTEHGSASKYADEFRFDVLELESYHPQQYIDGIAAAQAAGYDILVIDSLTHAWAGKDGVLELHDKAVKRQKTQNSYTAWGDVTPLHQQLIEAMLQSRLHLVATMRSKVEYVQEKDASGRTTIRKVGMAPVQRDGMEYEFDIVGDLDVDHNLVVTKSRCKALADAVVNKPGDEFAAQIKAWLTDGAPATERPVQAPQPQPANVTPIRKAEPQAETKPLPTAKDLFTYGRSKGLEPADIKAAFWSATGRESAQGWVPNAAECKAWAEEMDRRAAEVAGPQGDPQQAPFEFDKVPEDIEPAGAAAN